MKLLTRAYAAYAEADLEGGFLPPHFALVDLGDAETRSNLSNLYALANMVAQSQPVFSANPKKGEALHLVFNVPGEPTEFFNDHKGKYIGDYVQSKATSVYVAPSLKTEENYCLVPDNFTLEVAEDDEGSCAVEGGDGPVCCATNIELMVTTDGFWFTTSLEYFSAKLMTAVIPWSVLETVRIQSIF